MRSLRVPTLVLAVALAGCSSSPTIFTATQLDGFVLSQTEAPAGTDFVADQSGSLALDKFASKDDEKAELTKDGFEAVNQSLFLSADLQTNQPTDQAHALNVFAMSFKTIAGATAAYKWYTETFVPANAKESTALTDPKLGDGSAGFTFTSFADIPLPGAGYIWRVNNVIMTALTVTTSTTVDAKAEALATANTMQGRAEKA